jgi:hypothetical protein
MQQLDDLLADPVQVGAQLHQHLRGDAVALTDIGTEQDVLGADVIVAEPPGLVLSQDHNAPRRVSKPLEHRRRLALPNRTWPPVRSTGRTEPARASQ